MKIFHFSRITFKQQKQKIRSKSKFNFFISRWRDFILVSWESLLRYFRKFMNNENCIEIA